MAIKMGKGLQTLHKKSKRLSKKLKTVRKNIRVLQTRAKLRKRPKARRMVSPGKGWHGQSKRHKSAAERGWVTHCERMARTQPVAFQRLVEF